ncbi:ImmA/IrrE family metallo-endopeptidase [Peribacillus tepidiphilus]|uniref:ImmA/IrrE family metallo-endopeptidase n=1 Tax=Peribacillus tepidiphilus TaxID=2652445 RepID=UPI001CDC6B68|nr:ImmA/IrrE family metallo-endopeptidase [Peribacillus tepidiphilus]
MNYIYTTLEDYITKLYQELDIHVPNQLDMIDISVKLNIFLHFEDVNSAAVDRNGLYSMIIDRRLSKQKQWQDFGHELCHILLHAGNQLAMPRDFVKLQEAKANNFALHFCVPTFMLLNIPLPKTRNEFIYIISETFNVEYNFAMRRLEHFEKQLFGMKFFKELYPVKDKVRIKQA